MTNINRTQEAMQRMMKGAVEPSERWVRVKHNDKIIANSLNPQLLVQFGPAVMPTYFFTFDEIDQAILGEPIDHNDRRVWSLKIEGQVIENGAWTYISPPEHLSDLSQRITFSWEKLQWYEEAEQDFVHARDPQKRVDVMPSTRQIKILVDGQAVADTNRAHLLFETWLPTRYYIPLSDVNLNFLQETSFSSQCPYKGKAKYWTIKVGDKEIKNGVWSYPDPIVENPKIKDLLCFFNEKVDIYVDGELIPRPITPWA